MDTVHLTGAARIDLLHGAEAAGGTEVTSNAVDCTGYAGVSFFVQISVANVANTARIEQLDPSSAQWKEVVGSRHATSTDDMLLVLDCARPRSGPLRFVVDRGGADTALGDIYAVRYGGRTLPPEPGSASEIHTLYTPDLVS